MRVILLTVSFIVSTLILYAVLSLPQKNQLEEHESSRRYENPSPTMSIMPTVEPNEMAAAVPRGERSAPAANTSIGLSTPWLFEHPHPIHYSIISDTTRLQAAVGAHRSDMVNLYELQNMCIDGDGTLVSHGPARVDPLLSLTEHFLLPQMTAMQRLLNASNIRNVRSRGSTKQSEEIHYFEGTVIFISVDSAARENPGHFNHRFVTAARIADYINAQAAVFITEFSLEKHARGYDVGGAISSITNTSSVSPFLAAAAFYEALNLPYDVINVSPSRRSGGENDAIVQRLRKAYCLSKGLYCEAVLPANRSPLRCFAKGYVSRVHHRKVSHYQSQPLSMAMEVAPSCHAKEAIHSANVRAHAAYCTLPESCADPHPFFTDHALSEKLKQSYARAKDNMSTAKEHDAQIMSYFREKRIQFYYPIRSQRRVLLYFERYFSILAEEVGHFLDFYFEEGVNATHRGEQFKRYFNADILFGQHGADLHAVTYLKESAILTEIAVSGQGQDRRKWHFGRGMFSIFAFSKGVGYLRMSSFARGLNRDVYISLDGLRELISLSVCTWILFNADRLQRPFLVPFWCQRGFDNTMDPYTTAKISSNGFGEPQCPALHSMIINGTTTRFALDNIQTECVHNSIHKRERDNLHRFKQHRGLSGLLEVFLGFNRSDAMAATSRLLPVCVDDKERGKMVKRVHSTILEYNSSISSTLMDEVTSQLFDVVCPPDMGKGPRLTSSRFPGNSFLQCNMSK